jgi:pimeloyl-ACP methyl ester carboxylesterase
MKQFISLFFATFLVFSAHADPKELLYQNYIQKKKVLSIGAGAKGSIIRSTVLGSFQQKLDHNNDKDNRHFAQRYWVNKMYAKNQKSPVIFWICGEGACSENAVMGTALQQASQLGATVVALEHRYYGSSQPFSDLSTENLKYLTVDLALKDLVNFQAYARDVLNLKGSWLAIGGSYPGALAAYVRALYPDVILGSLASSGPVRAEVDFSAYDHHVAKMAGATCLVAVQKAVSEIEEKIVSDEGFAAVKAQFNASELNDRDDFLYLIADTGAAAVQYGMREDFCNYVVKEGLAGYVKAVQLVSGVFGNLVDLGAQAAENITIEKHRGMIGIRQWFYQSCTEFGFWQNAWPDAKESARSPRINAAYHSRVCERLFNINTPAQTEKTNALYYAPILESRTTNILFTNGSEDPWINLSITSENKNDVNPNVTSTVIAGAAHCDDLGSSFGQEVAKAKKLFLDLAKNWLGQK